jgi:hypothetical protein
LGARGSTHRRCTPFLLGWSSGRRTSRLDTGEVTTAIATGMEGITVGAGIIDGMTGGITTAGGMADTAGTVGIIAGLTAAGKRAGRLKNSLTPGPERKFRPFCIRWATRAKFDS